MSLMDRLFFMDAVAPDPVFYDGGITDVVNTIAVIVLLLAAVGVAVFLIMRNVAKKKQQNGAEAGNDVAGSTGTNDEK